MVACIVSAVVLVGYAVLLGFFVSSLRAKRATRPTESTAFVSILKPLAGHDDALGDCLESFAHLDHDRYELLLGVASLADPACVEARRFRERHPNAAIRIVRTDPNGALNPKVAQLLDLERAALGEVLVISDSNVAVRADYLQRLLAVLDERGVGLVSSVIAGVGERSLGAAMENLVIATHTAPGVVLSRSFSRVPISVGKSMAMRRADLARVGGFARVGHVLAEDHVLAELFHAAGFAVRVELAPIDNVNTNCTLARSLERHTRWAKMRRVIAPRLFAFEPMLLPVVPTGIVALVDHRAGAIGMWFLAALTQMVGAQLCLVALRGRGLPLRAWPLELAKTALLLVCWVRACLDTRVCWRGHELQLGAGTALEALESPPTGGERPSILGLGRRALAHARTLMF